MFPSILVILGCAALSVGGFLLLSRFVPHRWIVADADAAGALYATIGMVYAILVALGAIAVWEPRAAAADNTEREATDLIETYWSARTLDPPDRTRIQGLVVRYTQEVINSEWRGLARKHTPSAGAQDLLNLLRSSAEGVEPATDQQAAALDHVLARISDAADARRARVSAADEGMPYPLWPILILGGIISIAFLYLFGLRRTFPNGLMMFTVGGMVALLLVVIYQLEYPFSRGLAIGPDAFQDVLTQLGMMPQ
jgi:hypothetical protein